MNCGSSAAATGASVLSGQPSVDPPRRPNWSRKRAPKVLLCQRMTPIDAGRELLLLRVSKISNADHQTTEFLRQFVESPARVSVRLVEFIHKQLRSPQNRSSQNQFQTQLWHDSP